MAYILTRNALKTMENSKITQYDTINLQVHGIEEFELDTFIIVLNDGTKETRALVVGCASRLIRNQELTNLSIILVKKFHIVKDTSQLSSISSNQKFNIVIILEDVDVLIKGSRVTEIIKVDYSEPEDNGDEESDDDSDMFSDKSENEEDRQYCSPERKKICFEDGIDELSVVNGGDKLNIRENKNKNKLSKVKENVEPEINKPMEIEENTVKLNTLRLTNASETLIVKVSSVNAIRNIYFYFIVEDETCKMKCVAFSPFYEQLLHKITNGTILKISKAKVQSVNMSFPVLCDNKFEMVFDRNSNAKIEILPPGSTIIKSSKNQQNIRENSTSSCAGNSRQNSNVTPATVTPTDDISSINVSLQEIKIFKTSSLGKKICHTIITDDTDSMKCTLFNLHAEHSKNTGATIQKVSGECEVPGRTRLEITLESSSKIETMEMTEPESFSHISVKQPNKCTMRIADLRETSAAGPIQVKKVKNNRAELIRKSDHSGKYYYRCLVGDESGEITCTVHEPFVQQFVNANDNVFWKIERAHVKIVDCLVDLLLCKNKAELIVNSHAKVTMISDETSIPNCVQQKHLECESFRSARDILLASTIPVKENTKINSEISKASHLPQNNEKYTPLQDLALKAKGDVVNCLGVLTKYQKFSSRGFRNKKTKAICRLEIEDSQGYQIKATLWGDDAKEFEADEKSVIEFRDARVNKHYDKAELIIWPGASTYNVNPTCKDAKSLKELFEAFHNNQLNIL